MLGDDLGIMDVLKILGVLGGSLAVARDDGPHRRRWGSVRHHGRSRPRGGPLAPTLLSGLTSLGAAQRLQELGPVSCRRALRERLGCLDLLLQSPQALQVGRPLNVRLQPLNPARNAGQDVLVVAMRTF